VDPSSEPSPFIALIALVAFPVAFVGMWSFTSAILALVSGYRGLLGEFRIDDATAADASRIASPWFAMLGVVSYRGGLLTLASSEGGLVVRVARLFPFHPPICVPWSSVVVHESSNGRGFGRLGLVTVELAGRSKLRVPVETASAIARVMPDRSSA
jgi:hypothetical protein